MFFASISFPMALLIDSNFFVQFNNVVAFPVITDIQVVSAQPRLGRAIPPSVANADLHVKSVVMPVGFGLTYYI